MNKLSILCAAATLGAAMFISTEASARGGHHGGGHHGSHGGHHGGWHHGGWGGGWHHGGWHGHGGGYGYGCRRRDGFLAPMAGIESGVAVTLEWLVDRL
jgi:uncharacterized membrane protein